MSSGRRISSGGAPSSGSSSSRPNSAWSTESAANHNKESRLKALKSRFSIKSNKTQRRQSDSFQPSSSNDSDVLHITNNTTPTRVNPAGVQHRAADISSLDDLLHHQKQRPMAARRPLSASNAPAYAASHQHQTIGSALRSGDIELYTVPPPPNQQQQQQQQHHHHHHQQSYLSLHESSTQSADPFRWSAASSAPSQQQQHLNGSLSSNYSTPSYQQQQQSQHPPVSQPLYNPYSPLQQSEQSVMANLQHSANSSLEVPGTAVPPPAVVSPRHSPLSVEHESEEAHREEEEAEAEEEEEEEEEAHNSVRDLERMHVQQQHHRRSPLEELVQGLHGSSGSSSNSSAAGPMDEATKTNFGSPGQQQEGEHQREYTPHASPLMNSWPSSDPPASRAPTTRSPPLDSLTEEIYAAEQPQTGAKDVQERLRLSEEAVEAAHRKLRESMHLQSAWSNTNSARSSQVPDAEHEDVQQGVMPPVPQSQSQTHHLTKESPMDPMHSVSRFVSPALDVSTSTMIQPNNSGSFRRRSTQNTSSSTIASRDFLPPSLDSSQQREGSRKSSKTSRRWSIVEMEQAYSRMKDLFGSNASFGKSSIESNVHDFASSESGSDGRESSVKRGKRPVRDGGEARTPPVAQGGFDDSQSVYSSVIEHATPLASSFNNRRPSVESDKPQRVLPGEYPLEQSFTSEMRDELGPLHEEHEQYQYHPAAGTAAVPRSSSSPNTFVTSLSDEASRSNHLTSASNDGRRKTMTTSRSDSSLSTTLNYLGPMRSPAPGQPVPSSARSAATTFADEGWMTPRSSMSPMHDQAGSINNDNVLAWAHSVEPLTADAHAQSSSVLLRGKPSRRSNSNNSDTDGWTSGSRSRNTTPVEDAPWMEAATSAIKSRRHHTNISRHRAGNDSISSYSSTSLSGFRSMDKIELFLQFSQMKADHEALRKKSGMERDALFEALSETRAALNMTRREKEALEMRAHKHEVRREQTDHSKALLRSKTLWQERAQSASAELEKAQKTISASKEREDELEAENKILKNKVESLSAELARALETQQELQARLEEDNTSKMPVQSTPPRSSVKSDPGTPTRRSNTYTRLPTPTRSIVSPRQRHASKTDSLADLNAMQTNNPQSTPLHATQMKLSSPDNSLSVSPSKLVKSNSAPDRNRKVSSASTKSSLSSGGLDQSLGSMSPASTSAYAEHLPGRTRGLFDLRESSVGLSAEDMAFLKTLDS